MNDRLGIYRRAKLLTKMNCYQSNIKWINSLYKTNFRVLHNVGGIKYM